jgi:hypothetical protein
MFISPMSVNNRTFHERLLDAHSGWAIVDDNRLPRSI